MALRARKDSLRGPGSSSALRGGGSGVLYQPFISSNTSVFGNALTQSLADSVITQTAIALQPTSKAQIYAPFVPSGTGIFAASLATSLSPGLVQNLGSVRTPSLSTTAYAPLISNLGSTFAPSTSIQVFVGSISNLGTVSSLTATLRLAPGLIGGESSNFEPIVSKAAQILTPGQISSLASTLSPTIISSQTLYPGLINQQGAALEPFIGSGVIAELIGSATALFTPSTANRVTPGAITSEGVLAGSAFSPNFTFGLTAPRIERLATPFAPTATLTTFNGAIGSARALYQPKFSTQVYFGQIPAQTTVRSPKFSEGIQPEIIITTPAMFSPSLARPIYVGFLATGTHLYGPLAFTLTPGRASTTAVPDAYALSRVQFPRAVPYVRNAPITDDIL
jgi:hypothetical protein